MARISIDDRITRHFDEFDHRWNAAYNHKKADLGKKGLTGSPAMIKAGFDAFEEELSVTLNALLGEIAHVVRHRGRKWEQAHAKVRDAMETRYPDVTAQIGGQVGTRPVFEAKVWQHFGTDIKNAAFDVIAAHQDGYTSPKPDPLPVRHPVAYAALCGTLGLLGGAIVSIFGTDIRAATLDVIGSEHQSSPGTQPGSGAASLERPAETPAS